jgi:hypothetical protein
MLSSFKRNRLLTSGSRVQGVITEILSKGVESYEAEIVFETDKREVVFVNQYLIGNRWDYKVGQTVEIIYNPINAQKFIWDEGPYKPNVSNAVYAGAVCLMVSVIVLMTMLR